MITRVMTTAAMLCAMGVPAVAGTYDVTFSASGFYPTSVAGLFGAPDTTGPEFIEAPCLSGIGPYDCFEGSFSIELDTSESATDRTRGLTDFDLSVDTLADLLSSGPGAASFIGFNPFSGQTIGYGYDAVNDTLFVGGIGVISPSFVAVVPDYVPGAVNMLPEFEEDFVLAISGFTSGSAELDYLSYSDGLGGVTLTSALADGVSLFAVEPPSGFNVFTNSEGSVSVVETSSVPLPLPALMLVGGLGVLVARRRRRA